MMTRAQIMKLAGTAFYNPKLVAKCKWKFLKRLIYGSELHFLVLVVAFFGNFLLEATFLVDNFDWQPLLLADILSPRPGVAAKI